MHLEEKIGETLLRFKAIESYQIENVLIRQECGDRRRFGEIAVDLRYINRQSLDSCLKSMGLPLWSNERINRKNPNKLKKNDNRKDLFNTG